MITDEPNLPTDILRTLRELGVATTHHSNWLKVFHRILICDEQVPEKDLNPMAHHLCRFGKWYYQVTDDRLKELDLFHKVEALHIDVHNKARALLLMKKQGEHIGSERYNDFITTAYRFRSTIQDLQFALVSKICAVDHLTGVWNRYAMSYRLSQEYDRICRSGKSCVIAIIDFDHFKDINDQFGHLVGDEVLKTCMKYFIQQVRTYDIIFRYGGEEFLFMLPETEIDEATEILERLRKGVKNVAIDHKNHQIQVTISIGATVMHSDISVHQAIELADNALFSAKMAGRDCMQVWH